MNKLERTLLTQPTPLCDAFPAHIFALPGLLPEQTRLLLDTSTNVVILLRFEGTALASSHRSFQLTPSAARLFFALLQTYPMFCPHRALFLALYPLSPEREPALAWERNLVLRPIRRAIVRLLPPLREIGLQVISLRGQGYVLATDGTSGSACVAPTTTTERGKTNVLSFPTSEASENLFHEVAMLFPPMGEEEYQQFVTDIQQRGLLEPIWTYQRQIIDGIHRYRACQQLGIEPAYREWDGVGSLVQFVISRNLHRRHLTSVQKAIVALEIEKHLAIEARKNQSSRGGDHRSLSETFPKAVVVPLHAAEEAAAVVGTNPHYVRDTKKILQQAPELQDKMKRGELGIADAKSLVHLSENQRAEALHLKASGQAKTVKAAVLRLKQEHIEAQAQMRPLKPSVTLSSWQQWLPMQPRCDLLLTDPPYSTDVENIDDFAQAWLPLALTKVKSTGRAYVCIGAYPHEIRAYLQVQTSLPLQQILVWEYRNTLGPSPNRAYKQNWQAILYFYGPDAPPLDCALLTEQWSVQTFNAPDGRLGNRYHSWQKPDALAEQLIRHSTKPGDTVLDCFSGTGTFVLAAQRLGRTGLGCDISEDMLLLAEQRGCTIAR